MKKKETSYLVLVTWGTRADSVYASDITNISDAKALRKCAYRHGYRDARIVSKQEFRDHVAKNTQSHVGKKKGKRAGGKAGKGSASRGSVPV